MNDYQTVGLCLNPKYPNQLYTYKAPVQMVLCPGDTVLVTKSGTPSEGTPVYRAVCVGEVHETPKTTEDTALLWVVDKVDDIAYLERGEL